MLCKYLLTFLLFFSYCFASAQDFSFEFEQNIPISIQQKQLEHAWAGGLNAPQFNKIDLNDDKTDDLLVFDRTNRKIYTFLAFPKEKKYQYAPEYELFFPSMEGWVLLRDFDKDGDLDIFTHATFGIQVYENKGKLQFESIAKPIQSEGFKRNINLKVPLTDIPAIVDIDQDGDLDILTFDFIQGNSIELHQNLSVEQTGNSKQLIFRRITQCWGNIFEGAECGEFQFDYVCEQQGKGGDENLIDRTQHIGSTIQLLDLNGDTHLDLLIGDVSCNQIYYFQNKGTSKKPKFDSFDTKFPKSKPIDFTVFPAIFFEDVDFDGKKDLLASPNVFYNANNQTDFAQSAWFYKNTGSNLKPNFQFQKSNFLQDDMLDLGENAFPAFWDIDLDNDLDMFVGNKGKQNKDGFYASIYFFRNTGNPKQAIFALENNDFLQIAQFKWTDIKPFFQDIDLDGIVDFAWMANEKSNTVLHFLKGTQNANQNIPWQNQIPQNYPFTFQNNDFPLFMDVNNDQKVDLLIGRGNGNLSLLLNRGSNQNPNFQTVTDDLGNRKTNTLQRNLTLAVADLDENGNLDLILGYENGQVEIQAGFLKYLQDNFELSKDVFWNPLKKEYKNYHFGANIFPVAVDLNDDKKPDLMIGTQTGGLQFARNTFDKYLNTPSELKGFQWNYDTAQKTVYIHSPKALDIEITYLKDKQTYSKGFAQANVATPFEAQDLPNGKYLITGKINQRIIIQRQFEID